MTPEPLLSIEGLSVTFNTEQGRVKVVEDVGFQLFPGETLGLVGESGCGKSVTAQTIMRLLPSASLAHRRRAHYVRGRGSGRTAGIKDAQDSR